MNKTKLIIAVVAVLLLSGAMCLSSDDKKNDTIPMVVYLSNDSKDRPKGKVAVYLNEVKVFEGEVLSAGGEDRYPNNWVKQLDFKIKKGERCVLRVISEESKIGGEVIFDLKQKLYVWVDYNYDRDKKIGFFTFVLNDFEGGLD